MQSLTIAAALFQLCDMSVSEHYSQTWHHCVLPHPPHPFLSLSVVSTVYNEQLNMYMYMCTCVSYSGDPNNMYMCTCVSYSGDPNNMYMCTCVSYSGDPNNLTQQDLKPLEGKRRVCLQPVARRWTARLLIIQMIYQSMHCQGVSFHSQAMHEWCDLLMIFNASPFISSPTLYLNSLTRTIDLFPYI